jgi:hypothetical protein
MNAAADVGEFFVITMGIKCVRAPGQKFTLDANNNYY